MWQPHAVAHALLSLTIGYTKCEGVPDTYGFIFTATVRDRLFFFLTWVVKVKKHKHKTLLLAVKQNVCGHTRRTFFFIFPPNSGFFSVFVVCSQRIVLLNKEVKTISVFWDEVFLAFAVVEGLMHISGESSQPGFCQLWFLVCSNRENNVEASKVKCKLAPPWNFTHLTLA